MRVFLLILSILWPSLPNNLSPSSSTPVLPTNGNFLHALNNYLGCRRWQNNQCLQCSQHYFFNEMGVCKQVTPQCAKFNRAIGICEDCYLGYEIYSGQCIVRELAQSIDRGCRSFRGRQCASCAQRWYFDGEGVCQPVHPQCRVWEHSGECVRCYTGYELEAGSCVEVRRDVANVDMFCSEWKGVRCEKCADRAYFGKDGFCLPVNPFCRTWDPYDGFCLSCYRGFTFLNGDCEQSQIDKSPPTDLGCRRWDWETQICLECSARWVFSLDGVCVAVSDTCRYYDHEGDCTACYKGYELQLGECEFMEIKGPSDVGCKIWNWEAQVCLQCSERWTFHAEKDYCIPVSDQCRTYNESGSCTGCYKGFGLNEGVCELEEINFYDIQDEGCKIWDWDRRECLECSYRWFKGADDRCEKVPDLCKDYDRLSGQCTECYQGYELKDGWCIIGEPDYCEFRENGVCTQCYLGYKLNGSKCVRGNPLCRKSQVTGECTSCFTTYVLYHQICVPLVKMVNLATRYAKCCPEKLAKLKQEARIV